MNKWLLLVGIVLGSLNLKVIPVRATVSVDVSNNETGSSNQVIINTNTQNSNSTTDVRVETNGEVKEFHTQGDEEVNYQSDDGSVTDNVNNSSSSTYIIETNTDIDNKVNVFVEAGGEKVNEVDDATDSPEIIDNAERDTTLLVQEELSLFKNILIKWEEWNEAIKDKLRTLFE